MSKSRKSKIQVVEELLEQDRAQEALEKLQAFIPQTEEDELMKKILKIKSFDILKIFDESLIEVRELPEVNHLNKHWEIISVLVNLIYSLLVNDRLVDASEAFERGVKVFNNLKKEDNDYFRCKASVILMNGMINWEKNEIDQAFPFLNKSLEMHRELDDKERISISVNCLGMYYWYKGDLSTALSYFEEFLTLNQQLGRRMQVSKALNNIGIIYETRGELDQAFKYYKQSMEIKEELGLIEDMAASLNNIGQIFRLKGELDTALDYYKRCLEVKKEYNMKGGIANLIANVYGNIGSVYFVKGDLNLALEHHKKALSLREEIGSTQTIGVSLGKIGLIYRSKGNFKKAYDSYTKALTFLEKIGNEIRMAEILYNLVVLTSENEKIKEAEQFLAQLKAINSRQDNKIVYQQYRLAKSTVLKNSKRLSKKIEAQKIFSDVSREEIIEHELTIYAMLNLSEILLFELQAMEGEEEVLAEINKLVNDLLEIAKKQHSYSLLVQTYLFQSKLSLLELDVHRAEFLLTQARLTAEENGLQRLVIVLTGEIADINLQKSKWNDLIKRNASFFERLELSQVNNIVKQMIQRRVEDISTLPQFAVNQIRVNLFKMSTTGPTVAVSQSLPFTEDEQKVLTQMALFYISSLGQGQSAETNIGLFGPLPIPTVHNYVGIAYAFFINDPEYNDPRCDGLTYAVIVFSMPNSLSHLFRNREEISQIIKKDLSFISSIEEIDLDVLQSIKCHILGLGKKIEEI